MMTPTLIQFGLFEQHLFLLPLTVMVMELLMIRIIAQLFLIQTRQTVMMMVSVILVILIASIKKLKT